MSLRFRSRRNKGHAIIETTLMMPWIIFLFVGVVDFGFYAYAAINVDNSARAGALWASQSSADPTFNVQPGTCAIVYQDLTNIRNLAKTTPATDCLSGSLIVSVSKPASLDGQAGESDARVDVTFQMVPMFPIPGMMGNFTITRTAMVRINRFA